jgi:hypothetical protein
MYVGSRQITFPSLVRLISPCRDSVHFCRVVLLLWYPFKFNQILIG